MAGPADLALADALARLSTVVDAQQWDLAVIRKGAQYQHLALEARYASLRKIHHRDH